MGRGVRRDWPAAGESARLKSLPALKLVGVRHSHRLILGRLNDQAPSGPLPDWLLRATASAASRLGRSRRDVSLPSPGSQSYRSFMHAGGGNFVCDGTSLSTWNAPMAGRRGQEKQRKAPAKTLPVHTADGDKSCEERRGRGGPHPG